MRRLSLRVVAIGYLLAILVGPLAIVFYRTFEDGFDAGVERALAARRRSTRSS